MQVSARLSFLLSLPFGHPIAPLHGDLRGKEGKAPEKVSLVPVTESSSSWEVIQQRCQQGERLMQAFPSPGPQADP